MSPRTMKTFVSTAEISADGPIYFVANRWDDIPESLRDRFQPVMHSPIDWMNLNNIALDVEKNGYTLGRRTGHEKFGFKLGPVTI